MSYHPIQQPRRSGFGAATTADDVMRNIDLRGRVAVVTGGHSGLGRETVRALTASGAQVIVPARNVASATLELSRIPSAAAIAVWPMDLLDAASVDAFAQRFLDAYCALDILILNAGIMALPQLQRDARGQELQFATNHLGHFQLALRLWPALIDAGQDHGARVVAVSSLAHRFSPVVFDDLAFERRPYDRWAAYGQSKTANALFACGLDARGASRGVRAFAVHPGGILDTGLAKHLSVEDLHAFGALDHRGRPLIDPARGLKSVAQGAATQLWCATSPILKDLGGLYCEDCDVAVLAGADPADPAQTPGGIGVRGVLGYAVDRDASEQLWRVSEAVTGVSLPSVTE